MKGKKWLLIVLIIQVLVFVVFFQKYVRPVPIKIGLITDLSGKNSVLGISARNGLEYGINEINKSGGINGKQVELISIDHKGSKDLCLEGTGILVESGVSVVISPILSGMATTIIEGVGNNDILIIGPTVSSDELSGIDDNFIRISSSASLQGVYIAEVSKSMGDKKIAVVLDGKNSAYTFGVAKGFRESISEDVIIEEIIFRDNFDKNIIVSRLLDMKPDALFFIANGIDSASIIQLYAKERKLPRLYGGSWVKVSEINKHAGTRVEGMIFADSLLNPTPGKRELDFKTSYNNYFNIEANTVAIYFYESFKLYSLGATFAKSFDMDSVKKAIINIKLFEGVTENYFLDKYGDGVRSLSLFIIKNNKFELYED